MESPRDQQRRGGDGVEVQRHAHRDQEDTEQQAFERLDQHFDLAAIFRLREQQPREQRAHRHGEPGGGGRGGGAEQHEQTRGHEKLGAVGARDGAEEWTQQQASRRDDHDDGERGLSKRERERAQAFAFIRAAHDRNREQDRHDGDVLKQQDRKAGAADRGGEPVFLRQHLDDNGGGGERERKPDDDGVVDALVE